MISPTKWQPFVHMNDLKKLGVRRAEDETDRPHPISHYDLIASVHKYLQASSLLSMNRNFAFMNQICIGRHGCDLTWCCQTTQARTLNLPEYYDKIKYESWLGVTGSTTWRKPYRFYTGCRVYNVDLKPEQSLWYITHQDELAPEACRPEESPGLNIFQVHKSRSKENYTQIQLMSEYPIHVTPQKMKAVWEKIFDSKMLRNQFWKKAQALTQRATSNKEISTNYVLGNIHELIRGNAPARQLELMYGLYGLFSGRGLGEAP